MGSTQRKDDSENIHISWLVTFEIEKKENEVLFSSISPYQNKKPKHSLFFTFIFTWVRIMQLLSKQKRVAY